MTGFLPGSSSDTDNYASKGQQFEVSYKFPTVAQSGGEVRVGVTTGNKPIVIKGRTISFIGSSDVDYRAASGSNYTGGTPLSVDNLNVKDPKLTTVTVVVNPTVVAEGSIYLRYYTILSAGNNQSSRLGTDIVGKDTILPANTQFVFTIRNNSNTAASPLFWYITFVELNPWE